MIRTSIVATSVVMALVSLLFLGEMHRQLNGAAEQRKLADFWKKRVALEHLNKSLVEAQFADFKQEVGALIPSVKTDKMDEEKRDRLRDLASVIPHERVKLQVNLTAKKLLGQGKESIINHKYKEGVKHLDKLMELFPDSHHVVEAQYLIMEAYFNLHQMDKVVTQIDKMVELFPENRLTGFALLKLGGIYETQSRHDEALHIYRTILSSFSDKTLIAKANRNVKLLEF